jgi:stearoyl-CoA desaturase (delta-9 desaturase)
MTTVSTPSSQRPEPRLADGRTETPASHVIPRPSAVRVPAAVRVTNLIAVVLPFLALIACAALFWGRGLGWAHLGPFLALSALTAVGVTVGFHRLFTHRAFDAPRPVKAVLAVLGSMAVEGPVLKWVATHRLHHQHADDPDDPHSPHLHGHGLRGLARGLWHAHVGWLFDPDPPGLARYAGDLRRDRLLSEISRLFPIWVAIGLLVPAALGGLLTGTWPGAAVGLLCGGLARVFLVHHVTWSINSVCHLWGAQPFDTRDESRNNVFFGVVALGEGWHNNHHAFPTSARHGLEWWQVDVSYWIIRGMAAVGLAWDVRVPTPQATAGKRR